MLHSLYLWIDLLWLPIAFMMVQQKRRWITAGFLIGCMTMMRLQIEIMEQIGFPSGILPLIESHVNLRGLIVYSTFYIAFLVMEHASPKTEKIVFLGACLGLFFMAFTSSSLIMLL